MTFEEIKEDMKVLYKGKQIKISFVEVADYSTLQDKILPMKFSEESKNGISSAEGENEFRIENRVKDVVGSHIPFKDSKEVHGVIAKDINLEEKATDSRVSKSKLADNVQLESLKVGADVVTSESISNKGVADTIAKSLVEYRQISTSSGAYSEGTQEQLDNESFEVYVPVQIASSQSTFCLGLVKKLRVTSKRGRPKKASGVQRDPFEIGVKFKVKGGNRAKCRNARKLKKRTLVEGDLQIIPLQVADSNVKEALALLESAENMGLACKGDREMVIKQTIKKLDDKVL